MTVTRKNFLLTGRNLGTDLSSEMNGYMMSQSAESQRERERQDRAKAQQ